MKEYLRKFELNNAVLEDFDSLMEKHLDQIEELVISEIDPKSKLLNIVGLCINIKTIIIEGDQRTNVNAIIANICKPELLQNLILDNVKVPSNFSFKKLTNLKMLSLNNIRFCSVQSCLEQIVNPEKIEALNFDKVDFAKASIDIVSKFENLKYLNLTNVLNCKLDNLDFLNSMSNLEKINIENNILSFKELDNLINGKCHKEISAELISDSKNAITNALEIKENGMIRITVNGSDLSKLSDAINLGKINNILVIDAGNCNWKRNLSDLKKVKGKVTIAIKDVSCIDVELAQNLKEELKIQNINVLDFEGALEYEKNRFCYPIDTYIAIRQRVDELLENIDREEEELKQFLDVYKILGTTLMYDNILEEDIEEYAKVNNAKSTNLENGLLENKCVDLGFAEILKNCLAVLGIPAKIVRGSFAGMADKHVWNQVKLMDNWYNVDLSLDSKKMSGSNRIKSKLMYCLLSDKDFSKTHTPQGFRSEACTETLNQKVIANYFKGDNGIKACVKHIIQKIQNVFKYNKRKALPVGKHAEEGIEEINED